MTFGAEVLMPLVEPYLQRQGWYEEAIADYPDAPIELMSFDVLFDDHPGLGSLILQRGIQHFLLFVGWRNPSGLSSALRRRESSLLGSVGVGTEQLVVYEALADDVLSLRLLSMATEGRYQGQRVRAVSSLTSHASLVFDDRLFMKIYRVLELGERNEVTTTIKLDEVGFNALAGPAGVLRSRGFDLVFVREFVPSALEGRMLALTSLRDLLAHSGDEISAPGERNPQPRVDRSDPHRAAASAGGDLASETFRLGQTIGSLHLALHEAFGDFDVNLPDLYAQLGRYEFDSEDEEMERLKLMLGRFGESDLGRGIQLHGELHLRLVMRTEPGWIVSGFSDDPLYRAPGRSASLERRTGSPIEDLADMAFSIQLVANEALSQRPNPHDPSSVALANAWIERNQTSFYRGYLSTPGVNALLPAERLMTDAMLEAYRVVRERRYEATFSETSS